MRSPLRINGICGWAIPPRWFQEQISAVFSDSHISTFYPLTPDDDEKAKEYILNHPADLWIGYSLGSLWLLKSSHLISSKNKIALLSPVPGFTSDMGLGGKTRKVQLNYLLRLLERKPDDLSPVYEFLEGIDIDWQQSDFDFDIPPQALIKGLEFLRDRTYDSKVSDSIITITGSHDPLMNSSELKETLPDLNIVKDAGHHPAPLLKALQKIISR